MPEDRIDELEIKLAFQDDTIEALNHVITEQDKRIKLLEDAVRQLYREMKEKADQDNTGIESFDPAQEIPPHY
ncbi:MAG: SlyX family protein [Oceanospirillum sp.]|nr:SlyX family protein [Oceanospirillum sp.]